MPFLLSPPKTSLTLYTSFTSKKLCLATNFFSHYILQLLLTVEKKTRDKVNLLSLSLFPMIFTLKTSCSLGSLPFSFHLCFSFLFHFSLFPSSVFLFVFSYLCLLSPSPLLFLFSLLSPRVETMFLSH